MLNIRRPYDDIKGTQSRAGAVARAAAPSLQKQYAGRTVVVLANRRAPMSLDSLLQDGNFVEALTLLENAQDPGHKLRAFQLQVRTQRFQDAQRTIEQLLWQTPQIAQQLSEFRSAAQAEATATARLTDASVAGRRASLTLPPVHSLA